VVNNYRGRPTLWVVLPKLRAAGLSTGSGWQRWWKVLAGSKLAGIHPFVGVPTVRVGSLTIRADRASVSALVGPFRSTTFLIIGIQPIDRGTVLREILQPKDNAGYWQFPLDCGNLRRNSFPNFQEDGVCFIQCIPKH